MYDNMQYNVTYIIHVKVFPFILTVFGSLVNTGSLEFLLHSVQIVEPAFMPLINDTLHVQRGKSRYTVLLDYPLPLVIG
jgi:hypothetical protein